MTVPRLPIVLTTLLLGLVGLTACSDDTLLTLDVDLLSVIDETDRTGTLPAALDRAELPDEDGADVDALGLGPDLAESVERLGLALQVAFEAPTVSNGIDVTLELFLAPASDDLYASAPVATASATIGRGQQVPLLLELEASSDENQDALETVRGGDARIGLVLRRGSDGEAATELDYTIERFELRVTTRLGDVGVF